MVRALSAGKLSSYRAGVQKSGALIYILSPGVRVLPVGSSLARNVPRDLGLSSASWLRMKAGQDPAQEALLLLSPTCSQVIMRSRCARGPLVWRVLWGPRCPRPGSCRRWWGWPRPEWIQPSGGAVFLHSCSCWYKTLQDSLELMLCSTHQ